MRFSRLSAAFVLLTIAPSFAGAITFKDVTSAYPHREAIEKLSDLGVIGGNPDGTFRPTDPVNRAAMLKMLYIAAKRTPSQPDKACFPDVALDAWFAPYVCDAVTRGDVKGYTDGKFWPARPVSRAEALKITTVILGLKAAADVNVSATYSDVATADWFYGYVQTAIAGKILPMPGQTAGQLHPNWPLERGEAAAYIWRAKNAPSDILTPTASSSSSATEPLAQSAQSSKAAFVPPPPERSLSMSIPFHDQQQFVDKKPFLYTFSLSAKTVVDVDVSIGGATGAVSCRLYELDATGFATKYHLGLQEKGHCYLRASLPSGNYQLQLQPTGANLAYTVDAKTVAGDGNDGFTEAKELPMEKVKVDTLDSGDMADFYTFRVWPDNVTARDGGRKMTVHVISSDKPDCLVFAMADVDLLGFIGPECGVEYLFPVGTYVVAVKHPSPRAAKTTYSLQVR